MDFLLASSHYWNKEQQDWKCHWYLIHSLSSMNRLLWNWRREQYGSSSTFYLWLGYLLGCRSLLVMEISASFSATYWHSYMAKSGRDVPRLGHIFPSPPIIGDITPRWDGRKERCVQRLPSDQFLSIGQHTDLICKWTRKTDLHNPCNQPRACTTWVTRANTSFHCSRGRGSRETNPALANLNFYLQEVCPGGVSRRCVFDLCPAVLAIP